VEAAVEEARAEQTVVRGRVGVRTAEEHALIVDVRCGC